jgi:antitoxin VapB
MRHVAKLFKNGRSQAVRLPAEFRFEGHEVYIRRDAETGDVILSRKPGSWESYFALLETMEVAEDFMVDRGDSRPEERKLF